MNKIEKLIIYLTLIFLLLVNYLHTNTLINIKKVLEVNADYIENSANHIVNHNQRIKQLENK